MSSWAFFCVHNAAATRGHQAMSKARWSCLLCGRRKRPNYGLARRSICLSRTGSWVKKEMGVEQQKWWV